MQAPLHVVSGGADQPLWYAGMSTNGQTIDAWGLPSEAAHKLKSWLVHPLSGWELDWLPDQEFWGLEDQHLQAAGIVALDTRRAILRKLQERGE